MIRWSIAALCVVGLALSGCSSKEPTGKLENLNFATPIDGKVDIFYQPFDNGGNPTGTTPVNGTTQCAQNGLPQPDPTGTVKPCKGPYSRFTVTMGALFDPGTGSYSVVLTKAGVAPRSLGALAVADGNSTLAVNVTEDLTGKFDKVELRLDDFVYGVASAAAGSQAFTLAPGVNGVAATGTFVGHVLDVQATGLPASNATYMGMLYLPGSTTPLESFPLGADGKGHYESKTHVLSEFAQFHIHVGDSKLNLFKAKVVADA